MIIILTWVKFSVPFLDQLINFFCQQWNRNSNSHYVGGFFVRIKWNNVLVVLRVCHNKHSSVSCCSYFYCSSYSFLHELLPVRNIWAYISFQDPQGTSLEKLWGGMEKIRAGVDFCLQCRRHRRRRFGSQFGKIPSRRAWQPTPVFLPGESHGQRGLVGYSPWGCKESDTTEQLTLSKEGQLNWD